MTGGESKSREDVDREELRPAGEKEQGKGGSEGCLGFDCVRTDINAEQGRRDN